MNRITFHCAAVAAALSSVGCASTYGGLASSNNLGAGEYRPAVLVPPERQAAYEGVLSACRQAAFNRQVTAAHKAQQDTLTGAVKGAADGASSGFQVASIFKSAGLDTSSTRSTLAGGAFGVLGSLADSFASGTSSTSEETRAALLTCLRSQAGAVGYTVLEQ
ncbi:MAG: hypothetical protein H6933_06575 [Burkholderiaceae bacterium]|nr:hypothetical protein [Rhodoferax sp.]MCP5284544.1 hypothetical protein [Burkholderiaceae bacterium]